MANDSERVLIVGAGLAGLALAIALRRQGIAASVIERDEPGSTGGAGLYVVGAAMRALTVMGVGEAAMRAGAPSRTQTFCTERGRRLAEVDAEAFWAPCGPCIGIRRAALYRLLTEAAAGTSIRYGTTLAALEHDDDGVSIECSDGSRERYSLVVGADGIRSFVRRQVPGGPAPRFRGQVGWRFLAPRPAGIEGWTVFLASDRAFLLLPVSADEVYCYADRVVPRPIDDPPAGRLDCLRTAFREFPEPVREVLAALHAPEQVHFGAIEDVVPDTWGHGRALLVGDAAHAMSPNMACGVAMGVEDAIVLAELLGEGVAAPAVLARFRERRAARVRWVRAQTDRRDRLRTLPAIVRNAFLRFGVERTYQANYRPLLDPP
jgi:2-polyprenyl-6-methoxyphenol hydroxylase-like FAD-dependent oxidoreductase